MASACCACPRLLQCLASHRCIEPNFSRTSRCRGCFPLIILICRLIHTRSRLRTRSTHAVLLLLLLRLSKSLLLPTSLPYTPAAAQDFAEMVKCSTDAKVLHDDHADADAIRLFCSVRTPLPTPTQMWVRYPPPSFSPFLRSHLNGERRPSPRLCNFSICSLLRGQNYVRCGFTEKC